MLPCPSKSHPSLTTAERGSMSHRGGHSMLLVSRRAHFRFRTWKTLAQLMIEFLFCRDARSSWAVQEHVYNITVPATCLPHTGFAGVWTPATHAELICHRTIHKHGSKRTSGFEPTYRMQPSTPGEGGESDNQQIDSMQRHWQRAHRQRTEPRRDRCPGPYGSSGRR